MPGLCTVLYGAGASSQKHIEGVLGWSYCVNFAARLRDSWWSRLSLRERLLNFTPGATRPPRTEVGARTTVARDGGWTAPETEARESETDGTRV